MNSMFGGNMFADMDKMFGQQIGSIQNMLRDGNRNMITNGKNQNNQLANNKRGSGGNGNMMAARAVQRKHKGNTARTHVTQRQHEANTETAHTQNNDNMQHKGRDFELAKLSKSLTGLAETG